MKHKTIIMERTKENTLYLTIKQKYFDQILAGTKKEEYREIKDTTALKYLKYWQEDKDKGLYYDPEKTDGDPGGNICVWNNGVYPYYPKPYKYLHLAVGYAKDRDEMFVEVVDITFEPLKANNGNDARFDVEGDDYILSENGDYCIWQVVYHLGKVVETDLKKDR